MSKSKRAISLILALILILSVGIFFSACRERIPPEWDVLDDFDMDIRFLVNMGDRGHFDLDGDMDIHTRSISISETADPNGIVNTAVEYRNRRIEHELNVRILLTNTVGMQNLVGYLMPQLVSGINNYEVISGFQQFSLMKILDGGAEHFVDFNSLTTGDESNAENMINMDAPWWDSNRFETLSHDGTAFFVTGHLSQAWISSMYVSFVNARLWEEHSNWIYAAVGTSCIYEVVESGRWHLELWSELSNRIASTGARSNTVGFTTFHPTLGGTNLAGPALAAGSGVRYVTYTEDGRPNMTFGTLHARDFAERLYELYFHSNAYLAMWHDGEYRPLNMFADGNALMTVHMLHVAGTHFADMEDDFYILPLPKLDREQEQHFTMLHDNVDQYSIPALAREHVRAITFTLERMAYLSYTYVFPAYHQELLGGIFTDEADFARVMEMLNYIRTGETACLAMLWSGRLSSLSHFFISNINSNFRETVLVTRVLWERDLNELLRELDQAAYSVKPPPPPTPEAQLDSDQAADENDYVAETSPTYTETE